MTETPETGETPVVEVPLETQAVLLAAVDKALNAPAAAQGFLSVPTVLNLGDATATVLGGLDDLIGALDKILTTFAWVIPDQYETPLRTLLAALKKVKSWIDG